MIPVFATAVKQKYVIATSFPREDYPPANIAKMIESCEAAGRKDLADQIRMQWGKVLNKYPETRVNWGAAVKIGSASIKKNIFGGKDFVIWLKEQGDVPAEQIKEAKSIQTIMAPPKGTPPLAIPKDKETAEDWQTEAGKTKEALASAKKAFADVKEYIAYLEKTASDLKKKIANYGPGGPKSTTKTGESKMAARLPKWESALKATLEQIAETKAEIKEVESNFKKAADDYNHAPLTTVAYEKKAQDNIANILTYVLNMKDLDKQRDLLGKLNDALGDKPKTTASVTDEEITAASDRLMSLLGKIKAGFATLKGWLASLRKSVDTFGKLAAIRY